MYVYIYTHVCMYICIYMYIYIYMVMNTVSFQVRSGVCQHTYNGVLYPNKGGFKMYGIQPVKLAKHKCHKTRLANLWCLFSLKLLWNPKKTTYGGFLKKTGYPISSSIDPFRTMVFSKKSTIQRWLGVPPFSELETPLATPSFAKWNTPSAARLRSSCWTSVSGMLGRSMGTFHCCYVARWYPIVRKVYVSKVALWCLRHDNRVWCWVNINFLHSVLSNIQCHSWITH